MKIRHPLLLRIMGFFAALLLRLWLGSLRYRFRTLHAADPRPNSRRVARHWLYAFWHEYLLLPAMPFRSREVSVLISDHADGELIAVACRHLGFQVVRGSTTRNAVAGIRQLMRAARTTHLVLTPDGPRGPRRHLQPGIVYVAAKTGLPIVPAGLACRRVWRFNSWDRFALPMPFAEVWCVTHVPVVVPPHLDRTQVEEYRCRVEAALLHATAVAERLAGATAVPDRARATKPLQAA